MPNPSSDMLSVFEISTFQKRRTDFAIPAHSSLEKKTSYAHIRTMATCEESTVCLQVRIEISSNGAWRTFDDTTGGVIEEVLVVSQVKEYCSVANAPRRPTMPSGPHRNTTPLFSSKLGGIKDMLLGGSLHYGDGISIRPTMIEYAANSSLFITRRAFPNDWKSVHLRMCRHFSRLELSSKILYQEGIHT